MIVNVANNHPPTHVQGYLGDKKQGIDKCWLLVANIRSIPFACLK